MQQTAEPAGALSAAQLRQFERDGYLRIPGVLDPQAVLDPLLAEYAQVLDRVAGELYERGEIAATYAELGFDERLIRIYRETRRDFASHFDLSLGSDITLDTPLWVGPAVFRTLTDARLLDVVESLIGPEIYSNPVQHVRIKPPEHRLPEDASLHGLVRATGWHQDNGVVTTEADQTDMLTVWLSISDAPVESGCLKVIPGSYRRKLRTHCPHRQQGLIIPDPLLELDRTTPVPTARGDVIVMHKHTCHGSLSNHSDALRISLDLRYNPTGQATGRAHFPGFVARSRRDPASELRDPALWAQLWYDTRTRLAAQPIPKRTRWNGTEPACA